MTAFAGGNLGSVEECPAMIAFAAAWTIRLLAARAARELLVTFHTTADAANTE